MADQLQTKDLVSAMSGKDTLNGWDVLVSYDEAQINNLLSIRADSVTALSNLQFSTQEKIPFTKPPKTMNIVWNLKLGKPKLFFLGSQGRVRLTFSLTGSRKPEVGDLWEIDPGFNVQLETQLLNVSGNLSDTSSPATADFVPVTDAAKSATSANAVTLMPPDAGAAKAVCLNLVDDNILTEIVSTSKPPTPLPDELLLIQTKLKEYIRNAAGLKYYIAGLSNSYASTAGSDLLKPKAFCFTCIPGNPEKKIPGSLCMWISVEGGSDNGARASGQTSVTFHPGDKDLQSIPKGSTASVIFSHKLMTKYIIAAMTAKNIYNDFSISSQTGQAGLEIKGKCKWKIQKDFSAFRKNGKFKAPLGFEYEFYSDISFNMHDEDTTFSFGNQNNYREISIKYLSGVQNLSWYNQVMTVSPTPPQFKTTSLKFSHGGSAKWIDDRTQGTKTPNLLKLQFSLPSKFEIKDKSSTEKILFWDKNNAQPPDQYKDIDISLPPIDFNLRALDYFLTTNLVLPGAQLFIADEPSGKAGQDYGLFMPRDVILTGKVAKDLVKVQ
ncbi:hypothetical protein ACLMJK_004553 [Lecanora helva]